MRIGIFGGSFDPVHKEHVQVARAAIQSLALDKLFIMPAAQPPHKIGKRLSSNAHRLAMCKLAFADVEKAEVCDYEMTQGGTSYTYLTCSHFRSVYPGATIFFLVGTDMLRDFPAWKNPESILRDVTLAVCARNEESGWLEKERAAFMKTFGQEFALVAYHGADVSSTTVRVLAAAGEDVSEFLPKSVAEYIKEQGMYEIKGAKAALELEKPSRKAHSLRVAQTAAKKAVEMRLCEQKAIAAALFHDCGKNVKNDSPLLQGFALKTEWGNVPQSVLHQFTGAYLAERYFGVTDDEVLGAIRWHTSGKGDMTELEKLIFLADMVEEERVYAGVETLRALFWEKKGAGALDACLLRALKETVTYLQSQGAEIYPPTLQAYEFYQDGREV